VKQVGFKPGVKERGSCESKEEEVIGEGMGWKWRNRIAEK